MLCQHARLQCDLASHGLYAGRKVRKLVVKMSDILPGRADTGAWLAQGVAPQYKHLFNCTPYTLHIKKRCAHCTSKVGTSKKHKRLGALRSQHNIQHTTASAQAVEQNVIQLVICKRQEVQVIPVPIQPRSHHRPRNRMSVIHLPSMKPRHGIHHPVPDGIPVIHRVQMDHRRFARVRGGTPDKLRLLPGSVRTRCEDGLVRSGRICVVLQTVHRVFQTMVHPVA